MTCCSDSRLRTPSTRFTRHFSDAPPNPIAEHDALQVWESHGQWLSTLCGRFYDNSEAASQGALGARAGPESKTSGKARVMPVHLVAEQFACNECGFAFATQAALKAHKFKMRYEEDDKKARQQEIIQHKQSQATERARNGMPTCRHCGYDFESWPDINSRSCPEIKHFFSQPDCQSQLADLQVAQDDVLQAATYMTWQEMALLPVVKRSHNHSVECNHWCASPLYVRRHMRAKRPELMPIVDQTISHHSERFCSQRSVPILWTSLLPTP